MLRRTLLVAACTTLALPVAAQTTVTLTHPLPAASHYGAGAAAFKESVAAIALATRA